MKEVFRCRIDGSPLEEVWNLGEMYPSSFLKANELPRFKAPLKLARGTRSNVVQLAHEVDLEFAYHHYWYRSGLNASMIDSLRDVVRGINKRIELNSGDVVVDIGCNDSTMLGFYRKNSGVYKVGYEPAKNLGGEANCDYFINDFFSSASFPIGLQAQVISSIAMFYDLPDPPKFVEDITRILAKNGVWVAQLTDLTSMLKVNAFDNICAEHLEYYTLQNIVDLLDAYDLEIFEVEYNNVNGGSLRFWAGHKGVHKIVNTRSYLDKEAAYLQNDSIHKLKERIENIKERLMNFLYNEVVNEGKQVFVSGASTKGNTLLQYFGIDNTLIPFAAEVNKDKYGLRMVGSDIDIIPEFQAFTYQPDYFLVLPWHFKQNLINKYKKYIKRGGKLIFPLPYPHIITKGGEWTLD